MTVPFPASALDHLDRAFMIATNALFGDTLGVAFVFGGFGKGYGGWGHDIDMLIAVDRIDVTRRARFERWYLRLHQRLGLPPDLDNPGELVTLGDLDERLTLLEHRPLRPVIETLYEYEAILWADALAERKRALVRGPALTAAGLRCLLDRAAALDRRWRREMRRMRPERPEELDRLDLRRLFKGSVRYLKRPSTQRADLVGKQLTPLLDSVRNAVSASIRRTVLAEHSDADPLIRRSGHADFQSNVAMSLAARVGSTPRALATTLAEAVDDVADLRIRAEVSGPGFLNLTLPDQVIWQQVQARATAGRLGIGAPLSGLRYVVDYSAPNIAKEMHVGHLRSTIIGDALVRVLDFLGAEVIRQNHLGDWGTQFGMLIQHLDETPGTGWRGSDDAVAALDALYRRARARFDADPYFAERARNRVVALQSGDPATLATWRELVAESQRSFQHVYEQLGVLLTSADAAGESTYNDDLADVVTELTDAGVAVDSDGALCVFTDGVLGPDGNPVPLIVRKSDGGFGYAATDLATLRHRAADLKADRLLYVVDARQALHFRMVFDTARRMGWLTEDVSAEHVPFGTMLGSDGRPFKTRSGGTVRLVDLLDSAVARAKTEIGARPHELSGDALDALARDAGIGAIKYSDLSTSRIKDYTFDLDRMVSFAGDTGVYLQYAHARIHSILRKLPETDTTVTGTLPLLPAERALALLVDHLGTTLDEVAHTLEPHRLCGYLYALARAFTEFYESCPVLTADTPEQRANRAVLCRATASALAQGLDLLGISSPRRL